MDYDENDFQRQNFHLAGEGSTKFPPVLRPYALPKFEFDDSLPEHLRFDSLVETEVFLGIESNTDNQWIEDFSRGNSGIEFDSSATESCSISRRNNVWSEATSSESVEMLLKSVGQEENIPELPKEVDACDELGCLKEKMELPVKHDASTLSNMGDAMELPPPLLLDEIPENLSGSMVTGEEQPRSEDDLQTHDHSVDGSSNDLNPNAVGEKCGLLVTEGSVAADRKLNKRKIDTFIDESLQDRIHEDFSASVMQVDNVINSANNIVTSGNLSNQDYQNIINNHNNEDVGSLEIDSGEVGLRLPLMSERVEMDDKNLDKEAADSGACNSENPSCLVSKVESVAERNVVKSGICNVDESSSTTVKEDSDLQIIEDHSVINANKESLTVNKADICRMVHEVDESNTDAELCARLEPKMDLHVQIAYGKSRSVDKKELFVGGHHSDAEILDSNLEASVLIAEENNISKALCDRTCNNDVADTSSVSIISSSANLLRETPVTGNLERVHGGLEICIGDVNAKQHVSSSTLVEPTQVCEKKIVFGHDDVCNYDQNDPVSYLEGKITDPSCGIGVSNIIDKNFESSSLDVGSTGFEETKISTDPSNKECSIGGSLMNEKDVKSSSLGGGCAKNEVKMRTIATSAKELASGVTLEIYDLVSIDTMDGVSLNSRNDCTTDEHHEVAEKTMLPVADLSYVNRKEESTTEMNKEACSLTVMACPRGEAQLCTASEFDKYPSSDTATLALETGRSLSAVDTCNVVESQGEHQAVVADKLCWEGSKELEECSVLCDSTGKGGGVEAVALEKNEETTINEHYEKVSMRVSGEALNPIDGSSSPFVFPASNEVEGGSSCSISDKAICGSVAVIRTTELSQVKNGDEGVKGSTDHNVPPVVCDGDSSKYQSDSLDLEGNDATKDDKSVVSEVVEVSLSTSGLGQVDSKIGQDLSHGIPNVSEGAVVRSGSKSTAERKPRRASVKSTGKETVRKGNRVKEATPVRKAEKGDKPSNVSPSPSGVCHLVQSNLMQQYRHVECGTKQSGVLTNFTSALLDLNTSLSPTVMFQQPFTNLQQVQLRAQIFVYGSLIQGMAPDEAYMISAFGGPDGGKSVWEKVWRTTLERAHCQKSHPNNPETPLQSHSGFKAPDQLSKQSGISNKVTSSPIVRGSKKGTPSSILNPIVPVASPLWSISTPSSNAMQPSNMSRDTVMDFQQLLSPLHPYQTPIRNFGINSSWITQASLPSPWVSSSQTSALDTNTHFSVLPSTVPVELTPIREHSVPHSSAVKHVSPDPMVLSGGPPSVFVGTAPMLDMKKVNASCGQSSAESKTRKRKKLLNTEDPGPTISQAQSQINPVVSPAAASPLSVSAASTVPSFVSKSTSEELVRSASPTPSTNNHKEWDSEHRAILSEETLSKVKEARKQAEDAAALAATAVSHREEVWNQLNSQKSAGLISDVEAKLASAAVAIAAAASVAKAAAAAANVASSAALQAKLMADEALASSGCVNFSQSNVISLSDSTNALAKAAPSSILKGDDRTSSSSTIIVAAREAARKRVEAASAASKQAENLDALVKAAELAAEAVSHAGNIVSMGDPMSLSELVGHGPDNYWKVTHASLMPVTKSSDLNQERSSLDGSGKCFDTAAKQSKEGLLDEQGKQTTRHGKSRSARYMSRESKMEDDVRDGILGSITATEKNSRVQKGRRVASELAKSIEVVPESEIVSKSASETVHSEYENRAETLEVADIKEGSHVEVYKDGDGLKAAWFSAAVLSLKDGKAYVGYNELLDGDLAPLKEWVALGGEADKAPRMRFARSNPTMQFNGTRKRRRATMGDYNWSVGDRVDAWIQDSWCEGIVTDKNNKDETMLTVHIPAQGETSVVRAWFLRPSLTWRDGEWIEWSREGENNCSSHEGDAPQDKRRKLGSPEVFTKGKNTMSKVLDELELRKPEDIRLLDLASNHKVFNIGKNSKDVNMPDGLRMARSGLQKEGSRVIFGVPKPGKKRKFMDVSKQYVADRRSNNNEANDSVKMAKYSVPQGSGSRGWKINNKNDLKEEKRSGESRPKVLKSGNMQSVSVRTIYQKDNFSTSADSDPDDGTGADHVTNIKDSGSQIDDTSGKQNRREFGSFSSNVGEAEGPVVFSSLPLPSSKKIPISNAKAERANKGKLTSVGGKLAKIEEEKVLNGSPTKQTSEVLEPRRSIRRIQPTSRLLEGLQSSLIIPKIPSFSHDRSHKSQNRSSSRGNNKS